LVDQDLVDALDIMIGAVARGMEEIERRGGYQ